MLLLQQKLFISSFLCIHIYHYSLSVVILVTDLKNLDDSLKSTAYILLSLKISQLSELSSNRPWLVITCILTCCRLWPLNCRFILITPGLIFPMHCSPKNWSAGSTNQDLTRPVSFSRPLLQLVLEEIFPPAAPAVFPLRLSLHFSLFSFCTFPLPLCLCLSVRELPCWE